MVDVVAKSIHFGACINSYINSGFRLTVIEGHQGMGD